jgi:hypothetical protein
LGLRAASDAAHDLAEAALDLTVRSAVREPLPVASLDDALGLLRGHEGPDSAGPMGMVLGWVSSRWATRVLRLGERFSIPVRTLVTITPPVVQAIRQNTYEMHVLASLLVRRLRTAGVAVDARLVRRVVVDCYLHPDTDRLTDDRSTPVGRLVALWVRRALQRHGDRAERAARKLVALDLGEVRARAGALDVATRPSTA